MNPPLGENKDQTMNGLVLQAKLGHLRSRLRELHQRRAAAITLSVAALSVAALAWAGPLRGWHFIHLLGLLGAVLAAAGLVAKWWASRLRWSDLDLARMIESRHPDLDALLLTAVEQMRCPVTAGDSADIFKDRVLAAAAERGAGADWAGAVSKQKLRIAGAALALACLACLAAATFTYLITKDNRTAAPAQPVALDNTEPPAPQFQVAVTPGDTEVERGSRLVVEARFDGAAPPDAHLIVAAADPAEPDRMPMRLTIDQQVFGALIARVDHDAKYHIEFGDQRSPEYQITTFVYPALERADVRITPPEYSGLPPKEIKNTLKVTALEQSKLEFRFKVNKPIKDAELFGQDKTVLPLKPLPNDPTILTGTLIAEKSQKWRLHLVDDKERANKNPPWITVTVQSNQLAKIDVLFPKRDIQISSIQELPVEAQVWDDLGVTKSGASFSIAGKTTDVDFSEVPSVPARKQAVKAMLAMEKEGAEPRQLVTYHFWAEDKGPKGEVRRAMSDMFFADVRHFEDIFREAEAPPGMPGEPKGQMDKLAELQKQIVNATWRIIRDTQAGRAMEAAAPDVAVVQQSQQMALDQTKEAMEETDDAEIKTTLTEAWKSMKDALDPLRMASEEKKKSPLHQALAFEQSALEWLHRAQSREHRVMRQNQRSQGGGQQANQNQLMNLELKQEEQRYEEEKQATEEQSAQQQENLQVLNRLKELARRQEALAEKMKQLQNQLAQAKSDQERKELQNQLQRLKDEQDQLLRDLDDLKDRMEKPENAATMAEAREQLEQTREQVLDAAERLREESLAAAANSATRAQRELEKMQEDFRQKTARRFGEEMKQLREQARQTAERQKQIGEALEDQKTDTSAGLDSAASLETMLDGAKVARQIEEQRQQLEEMLESMRRVSEEAEGNNPLLHRNLYEAVREARTNALDENLEEARDQSRIGSRAAAQDAERKAAAAVEQLQKGVEKAAESVLGSESEALRMARSELNQLLDEVQREETSTTAGAPDSQAQNNPKPDGQTSPPGAADGKEQARANKGATAEAPADKPGEGEPSQGVSAQGKKPGPGEPTEAAQAMNAGEKPAASGSPNQKGESASASAEANNEAKGAGAGQPKPGQQQAANAPGQPGQQGAAAGNGDAQGGQSKQQAAAQANSGKGGDQGKGSPAEGQAGQVAEGAGQSGDSPSGQNGSQGESPNSAGSPQGGAKSTAAASDSPNPAGGSPRSGADLAGGERRKSSLRDAGGGGGGGDEGGYFFDRSAEATRRGPITGDGYDRWTDRLRNVEEMLSQPQLRNDAARILDNVRALRLDQERNDAAPQVDHLQTRIVRPLAELRDRVAEELAKRGLDNPAVPVDRDPVPPAYRDLVRRYYTELGAGQ